jgi:hypothetical protein
MQQKYDPQFTSATQKLLRIIDMHQLSIPLSIAWRDHYGAPPMLYVQIEPESFKPWLTLLGDDAVLSTFDDDDELTRHAHAEGALLSTGVRLHVVAVSLMETTS